MQRPRGERKSGTGSEVQAEGEQKGFLCFYIGPQGLFAEIPEHKV